MSLQDGNPILQPLIDNANEAGVKLVKQKKGNSVVFQRETDPPASEPLDDVMDDLDDTAPKIVEESASNITQSNYDEFDDSYEQTIQDYSYDEKFSPKKSMKKVDKISDKKSDENREEEDYFEEHQKSNIFTSQVREVNLNREKSKIRANSKPKVLISSRKKKISPSSPKNKIDSTPSNNFNSINNSSKKSNNVSTKSSSISSVRQKKSKNSLKSNSIKIFEILSYFIIIFAILIGIIISQYKGIEEELLVFDDFELDAIRILNDCITPTKSIPVENYPSSFKEYIINGSSKYIKYDEETNFIVIKEPHQSLFCRAINFADHHPDISGIFIVWMLLFLYFIHYSISKARAERIAPDVMKLLRSKQMCYLDEAKKKMKEKGYHLFGAWWQVVNIISNNDDVKTVKMVDTKPFWSLND